MKSTSLLFGVYLTAVWHVIKSEDCEYSAVLESTSLDTSRLAVTVKSGSSFDECNQLCCANEGISDCTVSVYDANSGTCILGSCDEYECPIMDADGSTLTFIKKPETSTTTETSMPDESTSSTGRPPTDATTVSRDNNETPQQTIMSPTTKHSSSSHLQTSFTTVTDATHSSLSSPINIDTTQTLSFSASSLTTEGSIGSSKPIPDQSTANANVTSEENKGNLTTDASLSDNLNLNETITDSLSNGTMEQFYSTSVSSSTFKEASNNSGSDTTTAQPMTLETSNNAVNDYDATTTASLTPSESTTSSIKAIKGNKLFASTTTSSSFPTLYSSSSTLSTFLDATSPSKSSTPPQRTPLSSSTPTYLKQNPTETPFTTTSTATSYSTLSSTFLSSTSSFSSTTSKSQSSTSSSSTDTFDVNEWFEDWISSVDSENSSPHTATNQESTSTSFTYFTESTSTEQPVHNENNADTQTFPMEGPQKLSPGIVAVLSLGIIFTFVVLVIIGKRLFDGWQRRHYSKMDHLINGIYN